ncbi:MAG TPA: glycosyltransferase family 2 protein [Chitinophagaceae bacterium]|nr:glycosyltransferase family 2 protein [Chitinophagaceae bacterium]
MSSNKALPDLSVVLVNYRSADLIRDCLDSIAAHDPSLEAQYLIVDNSSSKEDEQFLKARYPGLVWIDMGYNAGFARANNAGIRAAVAPVILLLNPDTLAVDDSLSRCVRKLAASPYAACGVQLLNADGSAQISGSFFMKGGLNHLLPVPYWGPLLRWIAFRLRTPRTHVAVAGPAEEVDWISGAFLMVRRPVIEQAGLLDEDFFLYAEEVEWCSRLRRYGRLCLFGDLHFIHLQGEAVNRDQAGDGKGYGGLYTRKDRQLMVSNLLRVRKQYGVGWFLFLLVNYTWGILVYALGSFLHRLLTGRNPVGEWGRVAAYGRNVWAMWRLAPRMVGGKPYFYKVL